MTALVLDFFLLPASATIAGLVMWASYRGHSLDDGALIRQFLLMFAICGALFWGGSRTDIVRLRLDPQFKLQTELDAHPVYSTIKRQAPDVHRKLQSFLAAQISQGGNLAEAFLQARSLLTRMTNERLGFADHKTRVTWGRVTVETLRELKTRDPALCYQALSGRPLDRQTLAQAFSADNTRAFQEAIVEVFESANRGMRHERPPGDKPVEFNEAALEYRAIMEVVTQRFGEPVSKRLAKKSFPEAPIEPPENVCAAMIFQLEAMLARPQGMAAMLIDSILR